MTKKVNTQKKPHRNVIVRAKIRRVKDRVRVSPFELGKAFLDYRKKWGISQEQLAKLIGLGERTIGSYESLSAAAAPQVQSYIQSGKLDASTAYEISTRYSPAVNTLYFIIMQQDSAAAVSTYPAFFMAVITRPLYYGKVKLVPVQYAPWEWTGEAP
jgi:transcriptional regulator with XRE-family HTH domain